MTDAQLRCEACRAPASSDDVFCEVCGASVGTLPVERRDESDGCQACGAPAEAIDPDGFCTACGVRDRRIRARIELDLAIVAAVSDQGRLHVRNDDAFHVERLAEGVVAVVCDGISMSASADIAAKAAASAAGAVLVGALRYGSPPPAAATGDAIRAAQLAVEGLESATRTDLADPSCTLVSAVCRDHELVVGWLGDSRAYWIGRTESFLLTVDNVWANEQVAEGVLTAEQAAADPRARSVTRWIGSDAPDEPPQIVTIHTSEGGRLVLCSDGFWSYAPDAAELARLLDQLPPAAGALAVARSLADVASARGGHDDITVAVVDVRNGGRRVS